MIFSRNFDIILFYFPKLCSQVTGPAIHLIGFSGFLEPWLLEPVDNNLRNQDFTEQWNLY